MPWVRGPGGTRRQKNARGRRLGPAWPGRGAPCQQLREGLIAVAAAQREDGEGLGADGGGDGIAEPPVCLQG